MFQKSMVFCLFLATIVVVGGNSYASQSMEAPKCRITGMVQGEETRYEEGKGLSEGLIHQYNDITVYVLKNDYINEEERNVFEKSDFSDHCERADEEITYQRREVNVLFDDHSGLVEKCIQAETNFSADGNFRSGNWIYDVEVLEMEECEDEE